MPEVVEADLAYACSLEGPFEALADLAAIERVARVGMTEDEVILGLVGRRLEQQLKRSSPP